MAAARATRGHHKPKPLKPLTYQPTFDNTGDTYTLADGGRYVVRWTGTNGSLGSSIVVDDHTGLGAAPSPPDGPACDSAPALGGGWVAYGCPSGDGIDHARFDLYSPSQRSWTTVSNIIEPTDPGEFAQWNFYGVYAVGKYWLVPAVNCAGNPHESCGPGGPFISIAAHAVDGGAVTPAGTTTDLNQPHLGRKVCAPLKPLYSGLTFYAHGYVVADTYLEHCGTHMHTRIGTSAGNGKILLWGPSKGTLHGILLASGRPVSIRVPAKVNGPLAVSDRNLYIGPWWAPLPAAAR